MGISGRRWLGSALAWLVGAVAAVVIGMQAVALLGTGLAGEGVQPLSGVDGLPARRWAVDASPSTAQPPVSASPDAAAGSLPPVQAPSAPPSSVASAYTERVVPTSGGVVVVRCRDSRAYLVSWSPETGYRADDVRRGPADEVTVKFKTSRHEVKVSARCVGGVPTARVESEDEESDG